MFIVVVSKTRINGNHNDYMRQDGLAKREGIVRALFSKDKDDLSLQAANDYLSGGHGRPKDGVNFEIVISLKDESFFKRLSRDEEKAKAALRDSIREGLNELFTELGVKDVRWTAAIHLNTDQPHVHIAVAPDCTGIESGKPHMLPDVPRNWKLTKDDEASRAASYFEKALESRLSALPPQVVKTIPPSYVLRQQLPPKALDDAIGQAERERVQSFLTEEKELSPAIVQEQLEAGTIYAAQHGVCVFVHRNPEGNVTGGTVRGKVIGKDGSFYIGDLRTATRIVLVDTPGEALSLYDLTKARDLSRAAFVSLSNAAPSEELLSLIAARKENIKVVWARGLDETGQQKAADLEPTRARLREIAAEELVEHDIEVVTFAPNKAYGATWNSQLIQEHLRGELEAIEGDSQQPVADARKEAEETTPEVSPVEASAEERAAITTERETSEALASLPVVQTLPSEPDVLSGRRGFNLRATEREAARLRQEEEEKERITQEATRPEKSSAQQPKIETNALRSIPLDGVLHAHGLRLRRYNGEEVYTNANHTFAIRVTNDLFADRKAANFGGKGAIDLVMHLQGVDFKSARSWLVDNFQGGTKAKLAERPRLKEVEDEPKPLRIQQPNRENLEVVRNYLINRRGLSPEIVDYCIQNGTLYANSMQSCVFLHRDPDGHITGAEWRSTDSHLRGTASGTEKQFGWFYVGDLRTATRYVVVEAPIDTLSYIELHKDTDISQTCFISLNGAAIPKTLLEYIANRATELESVELVWALDNNPVGKKSREAADRSFKRTMEMLDNLPTGPLVNVQRQEPVEKDWNDQLLVSQGQRPHTVKETAPERIEKEEARAPTVDPAAPNAIKSIQSRQTLIDNFAVDFNDGRYRWIGRATDENHARELATEFRATLEARGEQVNDVGVYKEGISAVIVPIPKTLKVKAEIRVVEDKFDGKWRIGLDAKAGTGGWSHAPSVFGDTFDSRAAALVGGAASIRRTLENQAAREDTSESEAKTFRRAIQILREFEAKHSSDLLQAPATTKRLPQAEAAESIFSYFKIAGVDSSEATPPREVYWSRASWQADRHVESGERAGNWVYIKGEQFKTAEAASEIAEACGLTNYTVVGYETREIAEGETITSDDLRALPEDELIARMESAPDFSYDAEESELTRRLAERGLDWRWISQQTASTGLINVVEAYPVRSNGDERQSLESDRGSEADDAGIQGIVATDGRDLSGGTEAEGISAVSADERTGDALRDDGSRHGESASDDAGKGRAIAGGSDSSSGIDSTSSAGAGGLGERGTGGRDSQLGRDISDEQSGRSIADVASNEPIIYARITNEDGTDSQTRSLAYDHALRAAETHGLTISGRYVSGTQSQIETANNALSSIEARASLVILTQPHDILLARTNGLSDWELNLEDFITRRHVLAMNSYQRGIENNKKELEGLGARQNKRSRELNEQIRFWQRVVDNPEKHLEGNRKSYAKAYESIVRTAISKGFTVSQEIIATSPLFRTAADSRERYEKGRHTSFGNKSGIIDDSMQEGRGYKVKRQDGTRITGEQVAEIATAMDEIESVIGSVRDILRNGDVTIAHTNGKRPFLSTDAGGMYHPTERTITTGTRNRITGSNIPVQAHEFGHFLDDEAGAALNLEVRIFSSGNRRSSRVVRYLSEADNRQFSSGTDDGLISDAKARMIRSREVERILSNRDKHAEHEVLVAREYLSVRVGLNYSSAREIWARLFEQYISTKLEGRAEFSADSDYTNTLGFWTKEDFERFIPRIEAQIERRLALVRTALTPEAARAVTEDEVSEFITEQTPQQVEQQPQQVVSEAERIIVAEEQPVIQLQIEPQTIQISDGRSEAQMMFEQVLEAMPEGTSFELAGEGLNGLAGRWVRVEEDGQPAWRTELDGARGGHYRHSADFYTVGVGDFKAEVNTLNTLIEEADGGIELLEQASIESEYLTSREEPAQEATAQTTEEIPIAEGLASESAYHRWLRSTHGCDNRRANNLSIYEQMRYRVKYLAARLRGEAPAQTGEDKESAAYRERLENGLTQAIADDARHNGQKATEISIRAHQRLRGVLDGFNSLDNKLTVEVSQPVAGQVVLETRDISQEVAMKREAGRAVIETLKNGDVLVEPGGNRWRVASAFTNSPDTTVEAAQLVCENNGLAGILFRDPKGNYFPNNAEYFASEAEVIRIAAVVREQIRREVGPDIEIVQAPFLVTEVAKLPNEVRAHVDFHLARLRTADEQLRIAEDLDARMESGTRYQEETWAKYKEESHESRRTLTEFLTNAMQNDVDGSQVLEELGGFPPTVKARMMADDAEAQETFETVPARIIIDGNTVQPIIEARQREQLEREAVRNAANVAAGNEDATIHWVQGDWPAVNVDSFFESPYGNEDDDPYVILNEALRLQTQRKFFIPLADAALESNIDPGTGRPFREKARKTFEHDVLEARHSLEATFEEIEAVMGRACGEELRRRVEAVETRSKETLVADAVKELSENEQAQTIYERNKLDPQNCVIALTRFIDEHISLGLPDSPTPVEVAEYNIALTTPGFFLEVAEKLHVVYSTYQTGIEEIAEQVRTSTPGRDQSSLFDESDAPAPATTSYLQIVGKSGRPVIELTEAHGVYGWTPLNKGLTLWRGNTQNLDWQQKYFADCGHISREIEAETAQLLSAENVTVYRSGVSSITDLNGYANAGAPVGVVINRLSEPAIERLIDYNRDGGSVFIDSGEFGAFKSGTAINFDSVLSQYSGIFERMENKAQVSLVMPDKIGDQARSIELIREHQDAITNFIKEGADVVIPIQRGEKSLSYAYREIVEILGTDDFRVAIPSNQKAVPQEELTAFLAESQPARLHLLGISEANKRFSSLIASCTEALPGVEISADANRLRAIVGANRKLTNAVTERVDEYVYQAVWEGDANLVIEDETEALYGIYNIPQYFSPEDAAAFARYVTNDADQQSRIIEASLDPDAPDVVAAQLEEETDAFDAPDEYGSKLGYVLEELFPGDRMYRWVIFEARQEMVRDQLAGSDVPASIRQQEITRIERDGQRTRAQGGKSKPITYRQTEVYGERVVIADVNGNVRMPKHLEGRNIAPEVAQAANSLKDGQYFVVGNTFYVRCDDKVSRAHYQNFVPLLIMRETGASVYALDNFHRETGGAPRVAQEFADRLREDKETVKVLMSEVMDKETARGPQQAQNAVVPPTVPEGWTLKSSTANQKTQYYLASERFTGYQIALYNDDGRWSAEILTKQSSGGKPSWEPARKSYSGTVEQVVREAERRGLYWEKQQEMTTGKATAKNDPSQVNTETEVKRLTPARIGLVVIEDGQRVFKEFIGAGVEVGAAGLKVDVKGVAFNRDSKIRIAINTGEANETFIGGQPNPAITELSSFTMEDALKEAEAGGEHFGARRLALDTSYTLEVTPDLDFRFSAKVKGIREPFAFEIEGLKPDASVIRQEDTDTEGVQAGAASFSDFPKNGFGVELSDLVVGGRYFINGRDGQHIFVLEITEKDSTGRSAKAQILHTLTTDGKDKEVYETYLGRAAKLGKAGDNNWYVQLVEADAKYLELGAVAELSVYYENTTTVDASKLVFDPAGKPEHRRILDDYFMNVAREDFTGHQGLPRIERALVYYVKTRGFDSVREPDGKLAHLDDSYRRLRLHLGEEQHDGELFSHYTERTTYKQNLILLARCVDAGDEDKAQELRPQVEKSRTELPEEEARAMESRADEVIAAERAERAPVIEVEQADSGEEYKPGEKFYIVSEETGSRLMLVEVSPAEHVKDLRLQVLEILATEQSDIETVENYLEKQISFVRAQWDEGPHYVVMPPDETPALVRVEQEIKKEQAESKERAGDRKLKQWENPNTTYWRVGGLDQRIGISLGYERDEADTHDVIRLQLADESSAIFSPHSLFPAKPSEVREAFGEEAARVFNDVLLKADSSLAERPTVEIEAVDEMAVQPSLFDAPVEAAPKAQVQEANTEPETGEKPYVLNEDESAPRVFYQLKGNSKYFGSTFTDEKAFAAEQSGKTSVEANLRASNVYYMSWKEFEPFENGTATIEEARSLQADLVSRGYDAFELQDTPVFVVLDPAQIEIIESVPQEEAESAQPAQNNEELTAELKAQIENAQAEKEARGANYIIGDVAIHDGGAKQRFKWNVLAIETLHLIESEERPATDEEKEVLARFSGFGSMPGAFNKYSEDAGQWNKERDQIKRLLTEEEFEAASRSTLNAHYTHPAVVDAIWKAVGRMGFEGGRVLEPALGSGVFFGRIPAELRDKVQLTGVELDSLTGRIAKLLYPQADIHNTGFQNVNPPDGWFDLVISNVPFGSYNVHDPEYNKYNAHIHDYFMLKSLDKVRDGGLVVEITSMGTLDKQDSRIREKLAEKADLVAAVRLPCTAFEKNAGTQVVTDILILQKRAPLEQRFAHGEKLLRQAEEISANADLKLQRAAHPDLYLQSVVSAAREDAEIARKKLERAQQHVEWLKAGGKNGVDWTKVTTVEDPEGGDPIVVNQYFADNPEMIVGTLDRTGSMYHGENVNVHLEEGQILDTELYHALSYVPRYIYKAEAEKFDAGGIERLVTHNEKIKAGGYVIEEGKLFQRVKNVLVPCEASSDRITRITKLLEIRDTVRTLFNHELAGEMGAASEVRARLNTEYDRFAGRYGYIHANKNIHAIQGDPDLPVLLALESKYTPGTSKKPAHAFKADIFTKPTLRGYQYPTSANNINEALSITLNEFGRLNIDRICSLLDRDEKEVGTELLATGLAYQNPRGGAWEIRDEYLSGNVRAKLAEAREAAKDDPAFELNVKALETVIPKDVDYVDIGVRLGSSWVPASDIADFMAHLVGGEATDFAIKYAALTGSWTVGYSKEGAAKHRFKPAAVEIWGTDRADLIDVMQHACDARAIVVRDRVEKDKYILNKEDTEAANSKLAAVKAEFKEWIWTSSERRERLHRYYNDHFNNIAPKLFDGSHLTFPGMNPAVRLRKNQVDAVWRTITTGKAIYAHKVGRGKTYTMIAAAMEMKRLGLVEKPCISCLKGNIGEITEAAHHLYPGARILSTLGNFEKAQRKEIVAQMATGDYDLIIMTHDNLDMLPMYPETRAKYIKEELKELEETIYAAAVASGKDSNRLVKSLENAKARLEADMLEILEKNKDDAVNFEETGVDFIFVDEFHKYKALKVYTKQDRVKGIPTSRSDRATNMLARIRWLLEQHDGRGAVGATGTPISNTTAELFNLMRYFQWDELNERGIRSFDAWASVFGETVTKIERTATGSYKEVTRFAKFTNLPELIQLSHQVMDVCMEDVPEIKLPKRIDEVITSELSDEQQSYLLELQFRAEELKGKYIKEKGADNMLAISNDARKMSLDMRLVNPNATDYEDSKVNKCVKDVLTNIRERPNITQLVFSDMGVHENHWGFSVYKDLKEKLVAGGLKPEEVIDFSKLTEKQRKQAIEDLATGKAKVGIGSTDKLGTGTNVQYHLYANHNLDVHWLPSSQLQRDGRIERQGNKHAESGVPIKIKRYVTVGGFDEIMYTAVDRKINFINQILRGDVNGVGREFVEVDGEELSAAQIAAIASGNPDVLRKVELEEEVGQVERSERRHRQSQLRLEDDARDCIVRVGLHEKAIERLTKDAATLQQATTDDKGEKREGFFAEIKGQEYTKRKDAGEALEKSFSAARNGDVLGTYKGFPICVRQDFAFGSLFTEMYLAGENGAYEVNFATAEGIFTSMDASLRNIEKLKAANEEQIRVLHINSEKIKDEIGKPFKEADRLKELRAELAQVEKRLRDAGVADGTNVKTGKLALENCDYEVELRNYGVVKELRAFAKNGGTVIKIDNKPVGWLKQDDQGALVAIEVKQEYRRHGVATRAVTELYEGKEFKCYAPDEQGAAWINSIAEHTVDEETGLLNVKLIPREQPEEEHVQSAVVVGYQTRVAISQEEQILQKYAEPTRIAEEGYRNLTGHDLSNEARQNFGRMMVECAQSKPTEEQEGMIELLMDEQGLDERPAIIENQVDAAVWIARRRTEIKGEQLWVNAALAAAQEQSAGEQTSQISDVGRFHRGLGADRSFGISLALDEPISREQTAGRELVDVRYVAIPKEKIYDPQGLIKGTNVEQSQADADVLASRLIATRIPDQAAAIVSDMGETAPILAERAETDAPDVTARDRTRILKDLGYEAEARYQDSDVAPGKRELIVFDHQHVQTVTRDVTPATVVKRAPEWKERAETAYRQEQEIPARETSGREIGPRYKLEDAAYKYRAAVEQTDLRRYKVEFEGELRRLSVKDVENLGKAIAHRITALSFDDELAKQQDLPVGERKSARVLRMEMEERFTAEYLKEHKDTIDTLRGKHEEVLTKLEGELEKATATYAGAVEDAVETAADYDDKMPAPIITVKQLDDLHDEAACRRDASAIIALDELRQNLIAEFGDDMQRSDKAAARVLTQQRMADLSARSSQNNLVRFEESYHQRRFAVEGENRNDYMPEQRGKDQEESRDDHHWSLKDVAKARKTVEMSQEWLTRNAAFYDGQTSFMQFMGRIADQHFNPVTQLKLEAQIITNPKRYFGYHLNPIQQLESNPMVQAFRFVKNYGSSRENAQECRRLADLEGQKLESLDNIESTVKEQIGEKRAELQADLAEQTELRSALEVSTVNEASHRIARQVQMPRPQFEEFEIRRIEAHAMELRDGNLMREYEAEAIGAKGSGLLKEENLPARAAGREAVSEARLLNAQMQLDNLDKVIENPTAPAQTAEGEMAAPLQVRDVMPVRVTIDGEDRVLSLKDVPPEAEELREAVSEALGAHETRLAGELAQAKEFHQATSEIADAYRTELSARGADARPPQFNVKEHLEIERFAAGVEDVELHERFSEIARTALDEGRVIGIDKALTQPLQQATQSAQMQAQTAQFEESIAANNPNASEQAINALARSIEPPQIGAPLEINTLNTQPTDLTNPSQIQTALPQPIAINAGSQVELSDATGTSDEAALASEAAATEEAAAVESLELFL